MGRNWWKWQIPRSLAKPISAIFGLFGHNLGENRAFLGLLGHDLAEIGPFWPSLGTVWLKYGLFWTHSGGLGSVLGCIWAPFNLGSFYWAFLVYFGHDLDEIGPFWAGRMDIQTDKGGTCLIVKMMGTSYIRHYVSVASY